MTYLRSTFRGSLALFGVALGLIGTAGVASAQEAATAPAETSDHSVVAAEDEASVGSSSAQDEDAQIGDSFFVERPAPRPDPGNELRSTPVPAPAPAAAPAPAPAPAPAASGGAVSPAAQTTVAAATPATLIPARPTEVRGVQVERSATSSSGAPAALARTGVDTQDLAVLAGALLALGALLIGSTRLRRITI